MLRGVQMTQERDAANTRADSLEAKFMTKQGELQELQAQMGAERESRVKAEKVGAARRCSRQ